MPYRRRYKNRKRPNRKPTSYMGTAQKGLYMAGQALAIARGVKAIVNAEKKTFTVAPVTGTVINNVAQIYQLSDVLLGDDYDSREGRSVLVKSIQLKGVLHIGTNSNNFLRIMLIQDLNGQGTAPTVAEVLGSSSVQAMRNGTPESLTRFRILYDHTSTYQAAGQELRTLEYYKDTNFHLKFDPSNSAQNSLWLLLISDAPSGGPTASIESRIRFYDN